MTDTQGSTPGPWTTKAYPYRKGGQNYTRAGVISADGNWIATEICGHKHDDSAWDNARLIAAAPELLEALRGMLENTWGWEARMEKREVAQAAVKKVEAAQ